MPALRKTPGPATQSTSRRPGLQNGHGASAGDGGRLRVQALDDVGVTLADHTALELQSKSELTAIEGEFAVEQSKALDGLELRQIGGEPLDFAFNEVVDPRAQNHLLRRTQLHSGLRGTRLHRAEIRHDQRGNVWAAITDQGRIQNERARLQRIFDGRG